MGDYYVGLDVHSRESVFVVQQADGVVIGRGCIPTDLTGFQQLSQRSSRRPSRRGGARGWMPSCAGGRWR